jgi:biopolymer transport protein ExbB/TolQ
VPLLWTMKTVDPFAAVVRNPKFRRLWDTPDRWVVMTLSFAAAIVFITFFSIVLPRDSRFAHLIFDIGSVHFPYPFTIQNTEHILLFIGLGELYVRWRSATKELGFLKMHLLPEDAETVLESSDLGPIRKRVAGLSNQEHGILPSLIEVTILQFQSGRSVDQSVAVMNSNLELIQHRVDLSYSLIRYIAWLIPTLGFIGTTIGIGSALASVPSGGDIDMPGLARQLSVGFDCTMVALGESAILVFFLHIIQEREELGVNLAGTYTLRNLINRLFNSGT